MKISRNVGLAILASMSVLLASCGKSLSGNYEGSRNGRNMGTIEFKSGHRAIINAEGFTFDLSYEIDGNDLRFSNPDGVVIPLTINKDGTLSMDGGTIFTKSK